MTREQLNQIRKDKKLAISYMADSLNIAEGTLKNFFYNRTSSARVEIADPIAKMLGVEVDDIIYSDVEDLKKTIEEMDNPDAVSVVALKKIHEFQLASTQEMHEMEIINTRSHYEQNIRELNDRIAAIKETNENMRAHYEQHHNDLKENFEKRLSDKRELLDTYLLQIKSLESANKLKNILCCILAGIFIVLFILELMHPEHGWLRW